GRGGIILMTSMAAAAGSGYTAAYAATKAFDLVLAEGLWIELGNAGVDVIAVPAGLTDTPAMQRSGLIGGHMAAEDPDAVAEAALDGLGSGPLVFPPSVKDIAGFMWPVDRSQLVRALTDGATALYGAPPLATPGDS